MQSKSRCLHSLWPQILGSNPFSVIFGSVTFPFTQAGTQISLADLPFSNEIFTLWYNLLPSKQMPCKKSEEETEDSVFHEMKTMWSRCD